MNCEHDFCYNVKCKGANPAVVKAGSRIWEMKHSIKIVLLSIGLIGLILSSSCIFSSKPNITTSSLPGGHIGTAYSQTLAVRGGTAPFTWTIAFGTLPPGLQLNPSTGVISGTPMVAGNSTFVTFRVTDHLGKIATKALLIIINPS